MVKEVSKKRLRQHLSADAMFRLLYAGFEKIPDTQPKGARISLADALMSGFAMFALKYPSLLAFDQRRKEDAKNLEMIFHIRIAPSDTQMRTIGKTTYYHQMLGAAIVHPDLKEVIPLMPEPIIKQDGETKNDCERNAAKRFFEHFRADHPHLPVIVIEDALSSNAPHIRECQLYDFRFLLGVKEGDHEEPRLSV